MRRRVSIVLLCLVCFPLFAKETIDWQTYHVPPINIKSGETAGSGFLDKLLDVLTAQMPQYEHRHPLTTHVRVLNDLRKGKNVCHPGLFVNEERKRYMFFSNPSLISPSIELVMPLASAQASLEEVDLAKVLNAAKKPVLLTSKRSYGPVIDEQLKQVSPEKFLYLSVDRSLEAFNLVASGRSAYTFAYPFEIEYFNQSGDSAHALTSVKIKGQKQFYLGSIACSKTPWGKKVIDQVNTVLAEKALSDEYINAMTTWWEWAKDDPEFIRMAQASLGKPGIVYP